MASGCPALLGLAAAIVSRGGARLHGGLTGGGGGCHRAGGVVGAAAAAVQRVDGAAFGTATHGPASEGRPRSGTPPSVRPQLVKEQIGKANIDLRVPSSVASSASTSVTSSSSSSSSAFKYRKPGQAGDGARPYQPRRSSTPPPPPPIVVKASATAGDLLGRFAEAKKIDETWVAEVAAIAAARPFRPSKGASVEAVVNTGATAGPAVAACARRLVTRWLPLVDGQHMSQALVTLIQLAVCCLDCGVDIPREVTLWTSSFLTSDYYFESAQASCDIHRACMLLEQAAAGTKSHAWARDLLRHTSTASAMAADMTFLPRPRSFPLEWQHDSKLSLKLLSHLSTTISTQTQWHVDWHDGATLAGELSQMIIHTIGRHPEAEWAAFCPLSAVASDSASAAILSARRAIHRISTCVSRRSHERPKALWVCAHLLRSCVLWRVPCSPLALAAQEVVVETGLENCSKWVLCNLLAEMVGATREINWEFLQLCGNAVADSLDIFDTADLAWAAWSLTASGYCPPQVVQELAVRLQKNPTLSDRHQVMAHHVLLAHSVLQTKTPPAVDTTVEEKNFVNAHLTWFERRVKDALTAMSLPEAQPYVDPSSRLLIRLALPHQRIAVAVGGYRSVLPESTEPKLSTVLHHRLLQACGWRVVPIYKTEVKAEEMHQSPPWALMNLLTPRLT